MSAAAAAIDARSWPVHPSPHLAVRCIYTQQSATSQSQLARVVLKSWHISLKNTICCSSLTLASCKSFAVHLVQALHLVASLSPQQVRIQWILLNDHHSSYVEKSVNRERWYVAHPQMQRAVLYSPLQVIIIFTHISAACVQLEKNKDWKRANCLLSSWLFCCWFVAQPNAKELECIAPLCLRWVCVFQSMSQVWSARFKIYIIFIHTQWERARGLPPTTMSKRARSRAWINCVYCYCRHSVLGEMREQLKLMLSKIMVFFNYYSTGFFSLALSLFDSCEWSPICALSFFHFFFFLDNSTWLHSARECLSDNYESDKSYYRERHNIRGSICIED